MKYLAYSKSNRREKVRAPSKESFFPDRQPGSAKKINLKFI
jgi:hypothetical protein